MPMPAGILSKLRHPVQTYRTLPRWAKRLYMGANVAVLGKSIHGLGRGVHKAWNIPTDLMKSLFGVRPEEMEQMSEGRKSLVNDILSKFRWDMFGQALSPSKAKLDWLHSEMVRRNLVPTIANELTTGRNHPVEVSFDVLRALTPVGWASLIGKHGIAPMFSGNKVERPAALSLAAMAPTVARELVGAQPSVLGKHYRSMAAAVAPVVMRRVLKTPKGPTGLTAAGPNDTASVGREGT